MRAYCGILSSYGVLTGFLGSYASGFSRSYGVLTVFLGSCASGFSRSLLASYRDS